MQRRNRPCRHCCMAHTSSHRTNRMRSTRKVGSCWRTTGSSASALAPRRRFRRAPSSAAFPVGSSCPALSISTPMWAAPCSMASPRTSKGPSTGWLSPWNALSPGNPCTASVCWGPWRPSNSAPPSSMTPVPLSGIHRPRGGGAGSARHHRTKDLRPRPAKPAQ